MAKIKQTRGWFSAELEKIGFHVIPANGNYVFATPPDRDGGKLYQGLYQRRILVRHFTDPKLAHGARISIGSMEEMERTIEALRDMGYGR